MALRAMTGAPCCQPWCLAAGNGLLPFPRWPSCSGGGQSLLSARGWLSLPCQHLLQCSPKAGGDPGASRTILAEATAPSCDGGTGWHMAEPGRAALVLGCDTQLLTPAPSAAYQVSRELPSPPLVPSQRRSSPWASSRGT